MLSRDKPAPLKTPKMKKKKAKKDKKGGDSSARSWKLPSLAQEYMDRQFSQWNKFQVIYQAKKKNNQEWKEKQAQDKLVPKETLDEETLNKIAKRKEHFVRKKLMSKGILDEDSYG